MKNAMDTLTHLAAGALTPLAFKNAPKTKMLVLFGILAGEFPDIDIVAGKSPEAILNFHRGVTHALALQPIFALVVALVFHRILKKHDNDGSWTFFKTWLVAFAALCIHLFLDCMTTFGTQIFLPFSTLRVALPAVYIIDPFLTLPLLVACAMLLRRDNDAEKHKQSTRTAKRALVWLGVYPLLCLAFNFAAAAHLGKTYATPANPLGITRVELSPEPFAPFNWKVVGISPDAYHMGRFFLLQPGKDLSFTRYERVSPALWQDLQRTTPFFSIYAKFVAYPFQTVAQQENSVTYTFSDVRYESTLPGLMDALGRSDGLFMAQAKFLAERPNAYRFLYRGRDAASTPWLPFSNK